MSTFTLKKVLKLKKDIARERDVIEDAWWKALIAAEAKSERRGSSSGSHSQKNRHGAYEYQGDELHFHRGEGADGL